MLAEHFFPPNLLPPQIKCGKHWSGCETLFTQPSRPGVPSSNPYRFRLRQSVPGVRAYDCLIRVRISGHAVSVGTTAVPTLVVHGSRLRVASVGDLRRIRSFVRSVCRFYPYYIRRWRRSRSLENQLERLLPLCCDFSVISSSSYPSKPIEVDSVGIPCEALSAEAPSRLTLAGCSNVTDSEAHSIRMKF